jgi:predicted P-loop ATPase
MQSKISYTLDIVLKALDKLHPDVTDEWLRAGMALKKEFGQDAFDGWSDWSSLDKRYTDKECKAKWKSFKGSSARGSVGISYIMTLAFDRGFTLDMPELSEEDKAKYIAEQEARRAALAAEWAKEEADIARWYDVVAEASQRLVPMLKPTGNSPYLGTKKVSSCGCWFAPCSFVIEFKSDFTIDIIVGTDTKAFFDAQKKDKALGIEKVFIYFKRGSILVPLYNVKNEIRNLQVIYNGGKSKRFLTNGQKSGLWYLIGSLDKIPDCPIVFCEGFATGASIHMATGWPVVVCFDAGNMPNVAEQWRDVTRLKIFAGDNDWETALDPTKINTGMVKSQQAAEAGRGVSCIPQFTGDAAGKSDFNDLHVAEGLALVKAQLQAASINALEAASGSDAVDVEPLQEYFANYDNSPPDFSDIPIPDEVPAFAENQPADERQHFKGEETFISSAGDATAATASAENQPADERKQVKGEKTVFSIEILLQRFRYVVKNASVWDRDTASPINKSAFNDLVGKELAEEWRAHPNRAEISDPEMQAIRAQKKRDELKAFYAEADSWKMRLARTDRGELKGDIGNAKLVLENDNRWKGVVGYCDFSYRVLKRKMPPFPNSSLGEWTDADTDRFRIWLAENYHFTPKTADALGAIVVAAEANKFHPVREYLHGLVWDRESRLSRWLYYFMGADNTPYNSLVGQMFLIGAVARVMQPPVKMDNVLIFEGLQGLGKSTALKILGGEWFTDTPLVLGDKDGFQQMQGVWIIELAELDSFNKADHTRAKQFFGSQVDRYRPSYGRITQTFARQCVFAGSTNQSEYLRDATGNRRYWPVKCSKIEAAALERERDQLWAEAYHRYKAGELWWPAEDHKHLFEGEQEKRFESDVWEELIEHWLRSLTRDRVLMSEIMEEALGLEAAQMKPPEQKRVGQIMAHLQWTKTRPRVPGGGRESAYERPESWKRKLI